MNFKRGNTYKLYCDVEEFENIEKLVFAINETKKTYNSDGSGDIDIQEGMLVISLSQEDTLALKNNAKVEIAIKTNNGEVTRSLIKASGVLDTIIEEAI